MESKNTYAESLDLASNIARDLDIYGLVSNQLIAKGVKHEVAFQLGLAAADAAKAAIRDMWMGYLLGKGE